MATLFGKALRGLKKGVQATGKGIGNAAKFTAKNPLKVLLPVAGVAGTIFTGGALAPGLIGKLAASKVGKTVFGKMIGGVMKSGAVVRSEITTTLKKLGKPATSKDVDIIEKGLQEEAQKQLGYKLPVDKKSSNAGEAIEKLKALSGILTNKTLDSGISQTIDAERQILIDNPNTNGILTKEQLDEQTLMQMKNAGSVKENLLGSGVSLLGSIFGSSEATQKKAKDALEILTGQNSDPYLAEDMNIGTEVIEAKLNESSIVPESVTKIFKMPIVWIIGGVALVYYFFFNKKTKLKF